MTFPTDLPDVEQLLVAYLEPILDVPVRTRVPRHRPQRWLQVRRIGGVLEMPRDRPRVDLIAWGHDDGAAHDLCMAARVAVHALQGATLLGVVCYRVEEFLGPSRRDDIDTGTPRMLMTAQLSLRAT